MDSAIGVRLTKDLLDKIERLSAKEAVDRSTIIRKLVALGYADLVKRQAAEDYFKGRLTISEAARRAELTVWEMERYLVEAGFKSSYSLKDLKEELKLLA